MPRIFDGGGEAGDGKESGCCIDGSEGGRVGGGEGGRGEKACGGTL